MHRTNQRGIAAVAILVVVLAVAVVIAAIVTFALLQRNKKSGTDTSTNQQTTQTESKEDKDKKETKEAAKRHFELVYAKKTDEAYEITCQGFKDNTSLATFKSTLTSGNFDKIDLSAVNYTTVEVNNDQARLSGEIGPLSPDTVLEVDLLKENGEWCVFGYRTR
ncbi:hypothetical protein HY441_01735 [Candidatus Microgenomates bacterium]|nr:hypothetical protein [Candidatus Microgenomates bacterium]